MMAARKSFEIKMPAHRLGNWIWARLQELMDGGFSHRERIDLDDVEEAENLIQFKRAIAERADVVVIRLRYEEPA